MAHGVLYYLKNEEWRSLLAKVKAATKSNGFNIFTLFIYDENYPCTEEILAAHYQSSFSPGEIQEFYKDWQEIRFDHYIKWDSHPGIPLHYHPIEKLVTRKPDANTCASSSKNISSRTFNFLKQTIESKLGVHDSFFQEIEMGWTKEKVIKLIGNSDQIQTFTAFGTQFNLSLHNEEGSSHSPSMLNGYKLELHFYGKYAIYFTNNVVSGKALYLTSPLQLCVYR